MPAFRGPFEYLPLLPDERQFHVAVATRRFHDSGESVALQKGAADSRRVELL